MSKLDAMINAAEAALACLAPAGDGSAACAALLAPARAANTPAGPPPVLLSLSADSASSVRDQEVEIRTRADAYFRADWGSVGVSADTGTGADTATTAAAAQAEGQGGEGKGEGAVVNGRTEREVGEELFRRPSAVRRWALAPKRRKREGPPLFHRPHAPLACVARCQLFGCDALLFGRRRQVSAASFQCSLLTRRPVRPPCPLSVSSLKFPASLISHATRDRPVSARRSKRTARSSQRTSAPSSAKPAPLQAKTRAPGSRRRRSRGSSAASRAPA